MILGAQVHRMRNSIGLCCTYLYTGYYFMLQFNSGLYIFESKMQKCNGRGDFGISSTRNEITTQ